MNYQNLTLKTKRLELHPLTMEYAHEVYDILKKHPEIGYYLPFNEPKTQKDTEDFIQYTQKKRQEKKGMWWVVLFQKMVIGVVGFDVIREKEQKWKFYNADIGYWLNPEYHRQGIMYEVVQKVILWAFQELKLQKVYANQVAENKASEGLLKKVGFQFVGKRKKHFFYENKWWDYNLWELIRKDDKK